MKQLSFILLITILIQSSCQNSNSTNIKVETNNSEKVDSTIITEPEPVVDTIDQKNQDTAQVTQKAAKPKDTFVEKDENKQETKAINIEDALDVNKYINVGDDPDYIGTPCEIVNGECIRHDHDNQNQPDEFKGDL